MNNKRQQQQFPLDCVCLAGPCVAPVAVGGCGGASAGTAINAVAVVVIVVDVVNVAAAAVVGCCCCCWLLLLLVVVACFDVIVDVDVDVPAAALSRPHISCFTIRMVLWKMGYSKDF